VLNDGAPNVGANWQKDAFNQCELALAGLKIAANFLRKGGIFITKIFRSSDYNSIKYVLEKFFKDVQTNKPLASRFTSAEIFIVCLDFLAPTFVDEKLFDSKFVFKDTESELFMNAQVQNEVVSIDKIVAKTRKRQGYADDMPMNMFKVISFEEFLKRDNPFAVFVEFNQITLSMEEKEKYG